MPDTALPAAAGAQSLIAVFDELERLLNKDERGEALGLIQDTRAVLQHDQDMLRIDLERLHQVTDDESGPLAEAQALADVLEVVNGNGDGAILREHTAVVLAHSMADKLAAIRSALTPIAASLCRRVHPSEAPEDDESDSDNEPTATVHPYFAAE